MTELDAREEREQPPPYIIFVVVSLFFLTGLLGFIICHLLKKKGYRCRTVQDLDKEEDEDEEKLEGKAGSSRLKQKSKDNAFIHTYLCFPFQNMLK